MHEFNLDFFQISYVIGNDGKVYDRDRSVIEKSFIGDSEKGSRIYIYNLYREAERALPEEVNLLSEETVYVLGTAFLSKGRGGGRPFRPRGRGKRKPNSTSQKKNNSGQNGETVTKGDPVDVVRGEYVETWDDFFIEGTLPIHATRYYGNQFGVSNGPLGRNRISPLDVVFVVKPDNTLEYFDEQGNRIGFERPHNGGNASNAAFPHLRLSVPRLHWLKLRNGRVEQYFRRYKDGLYRLIKVRDLNGNGMEFIRDLNGTLQELRHSDGFRLVFENDAASHRLSVIWVVDGAQTRLVDYTYDAAGNMLTAHCATAFSLTYTYDEKNRLCSWRDKTGRSGSVFFYDEENRVIRTETTGPWHNDIFEYDRANRVTTYRPGGGDVRERFWYDENQNVIKEETPLGGIKLYEYNDAGFRTAFVDENGARQEWKYDRRGNVTAFTDAEGRFAHSAWNDFGTPNVTIDGDGNNWRYEHDLAGNVIEARDPAGHTTCLEWTERGQLSAIHFADGTVERRSYDKHQRLATVTHANGGVTRFERDAFGRVVAEVAPSGQMTRFHYGSATHKDFYTPAIIEQADGTRIERRFDGEGQITAVLAPEGREWLYTYGPFDLPVGLQEPGGGKLAFEYDVLKRLVRVTDALGRDWLFERDVAGRVVKETDFAGQSFCYDYDAVGNVIKRTHIDGSCLTFAYDKSGFLVQEQVFAANGTEQEHARYFYDRRGLLSRAENTVATVIFTYDKLGQIVGESSNGRHIHHDYDVLGRRVKRRIGEGLVKSSYDPLGLLSEIVIGNHKPLALTRDIMGREVRRESGAGFKLEQSYDMMGRLTRQQAGFSINSLGKGLEGAMEAQKRSIDPIKAGSQAIRDYRWNKAFEPLAITDKRWGETAYSYDSNGQISETKFGDNTSEHFNYDLSRNINGFSEVDSIVQRWQQQTGGAVTQAKGPNGEYIELEYDIRNRVIKRTVTRNGFRAQTWKYTWDAKDRLITATTPDNETYRYSYDPFGRRVFKIQTAAAKAAQPADGAIRMAEYAKRGAYYEERERRFSELNGQIIVGTAYLWDGDTIAEEAPFLADGTAAWEQATRWHYEPNSFRPIAKETPDDKLFYIVTDHLGTPREIFTEGGALAWAAQYRTWGGIKRIFTPDNDNNDFASYIPPPCGSLALRYDTETQAIAQECPIRFQGQWEDAETGLYYNRHRYYDPLTAQYLSPDPIGLQGDLRPQGYVHNPNQWIDPLGLAAKKQGHFSDNPASFFKGTAYTDKVRSQMGKGDLHSFPENVISHADKGKLSFLTGGDGVVRQKLEIPGFYKGREGAFEFIKENNGMINHRFFKVKQ